MSSLHTRAAVRWSARLRSSATFTTIAPATRENATSPTFAKRCSKKKFGALLGRFAFDDEVLDWVRGALHESHADERREQEAAIERLRPVYDRLQNRIHAVYVDKLDGTINADFFENMSSEWRAEQNRCMRDIERHQNADQSYIENGVRLIELAQNAQRLFVKQDARE